MKRIFCGPRRLCALTLLIISLTAAWVLLPRQLERHALTSLLSEVFLQEMQSSTLNMHYTLAYPENYGIRDYTVSLPSYSGENHLQEQSGTENLLARLNALQINLLSQKQQRTLRLLTAYLESSLALEEYTWFAEPLSPSGGMQSELPILLAEYTFRTRQDVEDYLKLLDQTDEYFAGLLAFEQEKAEKGLLMSGTSLQKVIAQCDTILDRDLLAEESHFLQSTFRERLLTLIQEGVLTREEALEYVVQNNRLLRTVMQPAYETLADGLTLLLDDTIAPAGLASYPDGAQYYELLFASETGSAYSPAEWVSLLYDKLEEEYGQLILLWSEWNDYPSSALTGYEELLTDAFPLQAPEDMLADLQQRMAEDFPSLSESRTDSSDDMAASSTSVTVKAVSESLAAYCAPAFYLTPPLDDAFSNVIYINEQSTSQGLELYTTLAHEGFPGHLYQTVYYNSLQTDQDICDCIRELLWYGGYLEGWAVYVEFIAFDYASDLYREYLGAEGEVAATAVQMEKHNRSLLLCLYSLLDIMIHYENASREAVAELLSAFGLSEDSQIDTIYEYIVENPANYPKYYIGYLEICNLREEAMALWQEAYTDLRFHTFLLESGPANFPFLTELMNRSQP